MKFCDVCHSTFPADFTTCPRDQSPLRSTTDLQQGMVIREKYEILGKIGSGGMATVYRARHLVFNEERALKVVSSRMMEDENFLKRFRNEAIVTRKLQHPNAVRVEDMDTMEDGRPFIVMELVEGESLRTIIEREGPLPPARALEITRQIASALGAAHRLGIVHRDVKPDNVILVRKDGKDTVKVLDFGIAKLRDSAADAGYTATQTGMLIGTPQYISPEQAAGKPGEQLDGRADIYSLGIVLYHMITGRLPFESDTPMGILLAHMQTPPPLPQAIRPELHIDPSTTQLMLKCLEKDPAKRFQMAQELIDSIQAPGNSQTGETKLMIAPVFAPDAAAVTAVSAAPAVAKTVAVPRPAAATAPARAPQKPQSSGSAKWFFVAVVVLLIAVGGYFYVANRRVERQSAASAPTQSAPAPVHNPAPNPPAQAQPEKAPPDTANSANAEQERRVKALVASGRKHIDNGEYAAAIRDLREALRLDPNNAAAHSTLKQAEVARQTEQKVLGDKH